MNSTIPSLALLAFILIFAGCSHVGQNQNTPDSSENIVKKGKTAAELLVEPTVLEQGESSLIQIANHGETPLEFGRPFKVEKQTDDKWQETEASKNAIWTMELLNLTPAEAADDKKWPSNEAQPEQGS